MVSIISWLNLYGRYLYPDEIYSDGIHILMETILKSLLKVSYPGENYIIVEGIIS